jgi:hypothetical protein
VIFLPAALTFLSGALIPAASATPTAAANATSSQQTAQEQGISLEAAQKALQTGVAARAAALFETLAQRGESPDAEIGLVRALLQAGEFRKAMAYANLTAGEHPDSSEAAALLAFLLDRVGRTEQAFSTLKRLRNERPDDPTPVAANAEILIDRHAPAQARAMLEEWYARHREPLHPQLERLLTRAKLAEQAASAQQAASAEKGMSLDTGAQPSRVRAALKADTQGWPAPPFEPFALANHRIVAGSNGITVDAGKQVLTHRGVVDGVSGMLLVRNGLGEVRRAEVASASGTGELVRLRLTTPFPASRSLPSDQLLPPEGVRFCFAFGFSVPQSSDAAYPAIAPGLVVRADAGVGGLMQITSALGAGDNGTPIFDARGRLLGLALGAGDHVIAGKDLRRNLGNGAFAVRTVQPQSESSQPQRAANTPAGPLPPTPSVEELYERLAPTVVQIVALD